MNESVVVTGIGIVSAAGLGIEAFQASLKGTQTGLHRGSLKRETEELSLIVGTVSDEELPNCIEARRHLNFRHMSRSGTMVCAAAGLATKDGNFHASEEILNHTGIVMGTAFGGMQSMLKFNSDVRVMGPTAVNPIIFPDTVSNAPAGYAAIAFGMMGMNATLSTGFSSGLRALRVAYEQVASGNLVTALAGGYDELIPDLCHYWNVSGHLSNAYSDSGLASNPFDRRRNGFYPGEGAIVLVLERKSTAQQRSARIYGELIGFGVCQANDALTANREMKQAAMERCLSEAGVAPAEVGAVFASANGSFCGDKEEAQAIAAVFGDTTPVTAAKGYVGECMAAAGPSAVAAAFYSIQSKFIPGIPDMVKDDGEIPIQVSKDAKAMGEGPYCLINSFGLDSQGECVLVGPVRN